MSSVENTSFLDKHGVDLDTAIKDINNRILVLADCIALDRNYISSFFDGTFRKVETQWLNEPPVDENQEYKEAIDEMATSLMRFFLMAQNRAAGNPY